MVSADRIAQLADFIAALANMGFNFFGYSIPESLNRELMGCYERGFMEESKVFERLFDLNNRSVSGRYGADHKQETPEMPTVKRIFHERKKNPDFKEWLELVEPWHLELFKLLQCFIYQCDEDSTYKDPLKVALEDLERVMAYHIICNHPYYKKATWG